MIHLHFIRCIFQPASDSPSHQVQDILKRLNKSVSGRLFHISSRIWIGNPKIGFLLTHNEPRKSANMLMAGFGGYNMCWSKRNTGGTSPPRFLCWMNVGYPPAPNCQPLSKQWRCFCTKILVLKKQLQADKRFTPNKKKLPENKALLSGGAR